MTKKTTAEITTPLTAFEVADLLGVHWRTVHRMVARGELPAFKMNNHAWRFRPADIAAYVETGNA